MRRERGISGDLAGVDAEHAEQFRSNHDERSPWLGTWLQERYQRGFDMPEAEHLCLRIYYKFDGIPMALRSQLSRVTLATTFAELGRRGWIRSVDNGAGNDVLTVEYWQNLLTPNYRRAGPQYDDALGEAAFQRLQSGAG